ncbi:MAG: preprotein translocase subunit SecG [Acidimicrobiaceae bacterium]|jgi:preprotein translocase subunit SecG|nr:preprotein translocase subunit SecG [Acidimicrobiaceae bacterium]|tara:strand:- start:161 stop:514 length:354 start_codon:yes stop_codon:yes gene_type:complete
MGSRSKGKYTHYSSDRNLSLVALLEENGFEESGDDAGTIGLVLTWIVGALHLVSAFSLVGLVLLHSGKGGGVSDMFGGSVGATAAGSTVAEKNLSRITVVVAVTFGFTTLVLGLLLA